MTLLEDRSVPVKRITSVVELAVDRLRDKTAAVRRQALCVLTALLENNPFSGDLGVDAYTLKRTEIEATIMERITVLKECSAPPIELDLISGKNVPKKSSDRTAVGGKEVEIGEGEGEQEEGEDEDDEEEFKNSDDVKLDAEMISLNNQLTYVLSVLDFLNILSGSLPRIEELGRSKSSTDVIEVVRFFIRAVNFNIKGTRKCLQKTFSMIWHSEENIRQECLNAFKSTYLTDGATLCAAESLDADEVANNLIRVCAMCDVSESASLEQIIGELFSKDEVDKNVIPELWNMALKNDGNTSELELQHAADSLNILSMIAKFQPEILSSSRIRLIAQNGISDSLNYLNRYNETKTNKSKIGNGKYVKEESENENDKENRNNNINKNINKNEENKNDDRVEKMVEGDRGREEVVWTAHLNILKASMKCIQMITVKNILLETKGEERGSAEEDVKAACSVCFVPMRNVLLGTFLGDDSAMTEKWFSVCEETIFALYHIHPSPDVILSSVIPQLFGSITGNTITQNNKNNTKNDNKGSTGKVYCSPAKLSRLLFILGQCALCSVVYVEKLADLAKKSSDKKSVETKAVKEVEKEVS